MKDSGKVNEIAYSVSCPRWEGPPAPQRAFSCCIWYYQDRGKGLYCTSIDNDHFRENNTFEVAPSPLTKAVSIWPVIRFGPNSDLMLKRGLTWDTPCWMSWPSHRDQGRGQWARPQSRHLHCPWMWQALPDNFKKNGKIYFKFLFSYASSSTLYPRQSVSGQSFDIA